MTYEASLLGSHAANMATYALYVLVVFLINNFEVETPMEVVRLFFDYFGSFDWESQMITIFGAVKTLNFYDRLKSDFSFDLNTLALADRQDPRMRAKLLFTPEELNTLLASFQVIKCLTATPNMTEE